MKRPDLHDLRGRRVFITGASSGIGRATALLTAARGAELFLTDIDAAGLAETAALIRDAGGSVGHAQALDIRDDAAVRDLAATVHGRAGAMDIVMNVAGAATWGTVQNLRVEDWRAMVDVNLMGPVHVIAAFVPPMIDAGRGGHLVNVSSAAGLLGLPWHAAYSASKFGLRGVCEVLRFDLRRHGIGVSLVCPGAVDTPLTERVRVIGVDRGSRAYQRLHARFRRAAASPEAVAQAICDGVRRNRYLVHTSRAVRAAHFVERRIPPLYVLAMRRLNSLMDTAVGPSAPSAPAVGKTP